MNECYTKGTSHRQGRLSFWLETYAIPHKSLGFDYAGVEIIEAMLQDWPAVALALYMYGFNYLRSQCAYDLCPGGFLVSVYHLTKVQDNADQPEEVCIKLFVSRINPHVPSSFWIWKSAAFQEQESYDMFGIAYDNHPFLNRILMPDSWIGWPLRKDYIAADFYELQNAY
jgi:NAD(P)H-quinone oxidoreductase subunit J